MPFSAFNIILDDGTETKPDAPRPLSQEPWMLSVKRCLIALFPQGFGDLRIADLGCLEGGYTVEFARMGFGEALGVEARPSNFAKCAFVKERVDLPNLRFVQDDARNIERYGTFDAVFCSGLLYHLDQPRHFLDILARVTRKVVIINTHFATPDPEGQAIKTYRLSTTIEFNEGVPGRWFPELPMTDDNPWSSWENSRSFWIQREHLIQSIRDAGFPMVFEQFDLLGEQLANELTCGLYKQHDRGMFVGVKQRPDHRS